jgi:putative FmdB family regulatory protein
MPVYTFRCRKCGKSIEIEHKITAPHPKRHKGCGGTLVRSIVETPEVVYKGSGFYTTDNRLSKPAE